MYIPEHSENLAKLPEGKKAQMRILLQGAPGTGKTYAAMTFPNIVTLDFDNKMNAHVGKNIVRIPFFDADFVASKLKFSNGLKRQPNRKDALKYWLSEHGPKLSPDQTLVLDSWTKVQDAYTYQHTEVDKFISKKDGEEDTWAFWRILVQYCTEIFNALAALPCNYVVIICHEQAQRDPKSGQLIAKIEPLQTGQFCAKMSSYVTDTWRQCVFDRIDKDGKPIYKKNAEGKDTKEKEVEWYWQLRSSGEVNLNCSLSREIPMFIPASFQELQKYI